jgi:hypothetical protein
MLVKYSTRFERLEKMEEIESFLAKQPTNILLFYKRMIHIRGPKKNYKLNESIWSIVEYHLIWAPTYNGPKQINIMRPLLNHHQFGFETLNYVDIPEGYHERMRSAHAMYLYYCTTMYMLEQIIIAKNNVDLPKMLNRCYI